jgi:hypothetical protein
VEEAKEEREVREEREERLLPPRERPSRVRPELVFSSLLVVFIDS